MASKPITLSTDGQTVERAVCETHGPFEQRITRIFRKEFRSNCPQCVKVREEQDQADKQRKLAAEQKRAFETRMGSALIPLRFTSKSFDDYRADGDGQRRALYMCQSYAENFAEHFREGRSLILSGKVGTGKTHLACAVANYLASEGIYMPLYRTVSGLLQYIKGSYDNRSGYSESQAFAALVTPHLLVIDEVGATKPTEFELATLFNVINGRYEQQKPTIIITNLKPSELADALGERCVDRLREGGGIAVKFEWGSARKGAAA